MSKGINSLPEGPKDRLAILTQEVKELVRAHREASDHEHRQNALLEKSSVPMEDIEPRKNEDVKIIRARLRELLVRIERVLESGDNPKTQ